MSPRPEPADAAQRAVERAELLISNLLRYGVLTSLTVVMAGTLLSFLHHPTYLSSAEALGRLTSPAHALHDLSGLGQALAAGRGQAVVTLGLLLLIGVPVARVGLSVLVFVHMRDRRFIVITTIVFLLLVLSFFIGATG
ncbi:MAG TPA: DUF1634 domain-containing protein [Polyangiaceae bacterium]|nr:DUF1634 domain-containing protein [Polyangiaceae bacterium]